MKKEKIPDLISEIYDEMSRLDKTVIDVKKTESQIPQSADEKKFMVRAFPLNSTTIIQAANGFLKILPTI
jgi:hypothetical protein